MKKLHRFHCIRVVTDSNGTDQLGCIFSSEDTWFNFSSQRTQDTGYCEFPASYDPPLKLRGLSPRANYTDRAAAAGRRS